MKPLPTQQRAIQKRNALIAAATTCFAEAGYERTTAKSIAERAGVATGSFYQYFDNKDDLLAVIAEQRFDFLRANVAGTPDAKIRPIEQAFSAVLTMIYDFHQRDRNLHIVLEQRRFVDPQLADILDTGERSLEQRVLAYVKQFAIPEPEAMAFTLFAMAEGLVHRHVFFNTELANRNQVIRLGTEVLSSYFISHIRSQTHEQHQHGA